MSSSNTVLPVGNRIVEQHPSVRPNLHGAPTIDTGFAGRKNGRTPVHRHL